MALEKELQIYARRLPSLLEDESKYVLVRGDDVIGVYDTYEDAIKAGYDKFGVNGTFLVKQIQATEQVQYITRPITFRCRT